jgi:peroxiredoxin
VAISPQLERYGRSIHRRLNLGFDILTDHGLQVAAQFGLVFEFPDYLKTVYSQFAQQVGRVPRRERLSLADAGTIHR